MFPNLKIQLWKAGIRQNQLAKMINIDETFLSKVVNGFREPSAEVRAKISELLQMDQEWLFERSDDAFRRPLEVKASGDAEQRTSTTGGKTK